MVRVKICGITEAAGARCAIQAGANAVGINLVAGPRKVDLARALPILDTLPDTMEAWALLDATHTGFAAHLASLAGHARVRRAQLYGPITAHTLQQVAAAGLETVAVRHVAGADFAQHTSAWLNALGGAMPGMILLDAAGVQLGGTGQTIPWELIAEARGAGHLSGWPPIVLAGGLRPANVAQAIEVARPAWVDVSSGVESRVAVKDPALVRDFVNAVTRVSQP